jgi:hypothetical protein
MRFMWGFPEWLPKGKINMVFRHKRRKSNTQIGPFRFKSGQEICSWNSVEVTGAQVEIADFFNNHVIGNFHVCCLFNCFHQLK